ncbi:cell envelope-related function transcriptional attenuator common domain-containing protein [Thermomonospora echinospora]|uniref:Cell envelope-related function transcriptional attenuator common domain-containing protein n=1 Tax=Thermomonospora echinospora TaxID=1992 RepID=A0A1H5WEP0_9ACTN|nr:LCP family protein [Thermomonospora echinospora]SEF97828.1 cell envelope-related function transcriptional attenuator common domain-containing protein [Thermomonospora echinospora]
MNSNPMYMEYVDDADPAPERRRGWRVLGWVAIGLSVTLVSSSLGVYGYYRKLNGNIARENINYGPRPEKLNDALNILVLGSDTRTGANAKYGKSMKNDPPRSDTMILLHLSPGGEQAIGISFPRDLMVPIPSCRSREGGTVPASSLAMINESFTRGGAACTVKTIEHLTNIKIDHFLQVDFVGFKSITSAVGGVEVCLPKDVNDPQARLRLSKGRHTIEGETALAYVRVRKGLGNGSDTDRIKRQQQFLASLANKAMSAGVLSNPVKLNALLSASTKSLTTDEELNIGAMTKIARGMQGLTAGKLRFVTVPWGAYAPDPNRVALRQPDADRFFSAIRSDTGIAEERPAAGSSSKISPRQVRVRVYNASGIDGQARRVADQLEEQGYQVAGVGNLSSRRNTRVLYGPGAEHQAQALAEVVSGADRPAARANGSPGIVDLVVGPDWTALKPRKTGIPRQQDEVRATDDVCKT